jgi:hypothetical protein
MKLENWCFFFQPESKMFHYCDVEKSPPSIETIELDINFMIFNNHRSILGCDKKIYLIGGYNDTEINDKNEDNYKEVFVLDLPNKTLKKVSNLITL